MIKMAQQSTARDQTLARYVEKIRRFPLLDREQELALAARVQQGDAAAAHMLVESSLRYVPNIAAKYIGYGLHLADLIEEGNLGLLEAVRHFDPGRKLRFMTYATYWVRAYTLNHVLKNWSIVSFGTSPLQSRLFFRLRREQNKISERLGGDETTEESLAKTLGTTPQRIASTQGRLMGKDVSLDVPIFQEGDVTLGELLFDDAKNQEERYGENEVRSQIRQALNCVWDTLDPREQVIVQKRFLVDSQDEKTLADLGRHFGVSRERMRQIEERLKKKLRPLFVTEHRMD